jgi:hypothetical protein
MFDILAYAVFVVAIIGFLRFAARGLPRDEISGQAAGKNQTSSAR